LVPVGPREQPTASAARRTAAPPHCTPCRIVEVLSA
jgi:hypothetical protein